MSKKSYQLGIIGAGTMGKIIAMAVAEKKVFGRPNILLFDKNKAKLAVLRRAGFATTQGLPEVLQSCQLILLAIKPQDFLSIREEISKYITKKQLLISLMAGVGLVSLSKTGAREIVRCMPNLPAKVGMGATFWYASSGASRRHRQLAARIFAALGREFYIKKKGAAADYVIDKAAAITGSGPAYVYYFMELLEREARRLGFTKRQSAVMAEITFAGALMLLLEEKMTPAELRAMVTSKKGTTERAVREFTKAIPQAFHLGLDQAVKRAIYLRKNIN